MIKYLLQSPLILPKGDDINGIFSYYLNKSINPLDSFLTIDVSGSFKDDDPNSIINWKENGRWASNDVYNSWISLTFSYNPMMMTHFSFIGHEGYNFATNFDVEGFNGREWVFIQNFNSSDYCDTFLNQFNEYVCKNSNVETWEITNPSYFYGYKWIEKTCSTENLNFISMKGIDIFGQIDPFIYCDLCKNTKIINRITNYFYYSIILLK